MIGHGVDMYDLIDGLRADDSRIQPLNEEIWIGVIEQMSPSPPVPRMRTRSYVCCPVYMFEGKRIFSMITDYVTRFRDFYYIPENELRFVRKSVKVHV